MKLRSWIDGVFVLCLLLSLWLAAPCLNPPAHAEPAGTIHYVKSGGAASGACDSWTNACELQYALGVAAVGDEIWVAAGTHKPTTGIDRTISFELKSGVALYGGFAGTETSRDERNPDPATNGTVLSGDLLRNDGPNFANNGDNSYHVVYSSGVTETAVLDGFTVSGGNADVSPPPKEWGGGMYLRESSPTIRHVIFQGNSARSGGGMFSNGGQPVLENVEFSGNTATVNGGGGGMTTYDGSSPMLINVTFIGNMASGVGGGMYNFSNCSPALTNVAFIGNTANGSSGGGMENVQSNPTLTNVTFSSNAASVFGGGVHNSYSNPTLRNCILWGNAAPSGPQIFNSASTPDIGYSDIQDSGGSGTWDAGLGTDGGGNIDADPRFFDADGPDNTPGTSDDDLRLQLTSPAIEAGGSSAVPLEVTTDLGGNPRFVGTVDMGAYEAPPPIIYVDVDATGANTGLSWADAFTDLQDSMTWAVDGVEVWVAEGTYRPASGADRYATFQLVSGVEVYGGFDPDAGDIAFEDRDWASNVTILSGDIGTPGDSSDNSYHVVTGSGVNETAVLDGFTISGGNANVGVQPIEWGGGMFLQDSSPTIRDVIFEGNSARGGGGMFIHGGQPVLVDVEFLQNQATVNGGGLHTYHGSSPQLTNVTFVGNTAILDGGGALLVNSNPTIRQAVFEGNSARSGGGVFSNGGQLVLEDIEFLQNLATEDGGGMYADYQSPELTNVTFVGNTATSDGGGMYNNYSSSGLTDVTFSDNTADDGGGIYNSDSSPVLTNCTFSGNRTSVSGGGMYSLASEPVLSNCTFSANAAGLDGGGMYNDGSSPTLTNVTFTGNTAAFSGGGLFNGWSSRPKVTNCTFSGNEAQDGGGGMANVLSSATLTNVTFSGNTADDGGGIYNYSSNPTLRNCILWGNAAPSGPQIYNGVSTPDIAYSDLQDSGGSGAWDASLGTDGGGNLDADPQFVDADGPDNVIGTSDDNLRLGTASPAIDVGNNAALPPDSLDLDGDGDTSEPLPIDLDGRDRISNSTIDLGAYEWRAGNSPPIAEDDAADTQEDTSVSIPVLENDIDPDHDALSIYALTQPENGRVQRAGTTNILYTPYLNFYGSDSFTYQVYDGSDGLDTATVAVTVDAVNDPPIAQDDEATTPEDMPLSIAVLANDTDPEDDPFLLQSVGQPSRGMTEVNGDFIIYTPDTNFSGDDAFFYTLSDGQASSPANVRIAVTPVNDAPSDISLDNATISENQPPGAHVGSFSTADPDIADSHSYRLVSGDGDEDNNAFYVIGSTLQTAVSFDFETKNAYHIRVETDDGQGGSLAEPFLIQVSDANDPPTDISLSNARVLENQPLGTLLGTLSASDPDSGETFSYSLVSGTGSDDNSLFFVNGNNLEAATSFDFEEKTARSIRVRADDSRGGVFEKVFRIDIVNDPGDAPLPQLSKCSGEPFSLIETGQTQIILGSITVTGSSPSGCDLTGLMRITLPGGNDVAGLPFKGRVNQSNQLLTDREEDYIQDFDLNLAGLTLKAADVVIDYYLQRPMLRFGRPALAIPEEWGGLDAALPNPVVIDGSGLKFGVAEFGLPEIKTQAGFALSLKGELMPVAGGYEVKASGELTIPNIGKKKAPNSEGQECSISVAVTIFAGVDGQATMLLKTEQRVDNVSATSLRLSEIQVGMECSVGIPIGSTGFALTGVRGTVSLRPNEEFVEVGVTISAVKDLGGIPIIEVDGSTKVTINPAFRLDLAVALKVLVFEMAKAEATITTSSFEANLTITSLIYEGKVSIHAWTSAGAFHFTGSGSIRVGVDKCGWVDGGCIFGYPTCSTCWRWFVPYPCRCRWTCVLEACIPPFELWSPTVGCEFGEFTNGAYGIKGYVDFSGASYGFFIDHTGTLAFGDVGTYQLYTSSQVQQFVDMAQQRDLITTASVMDVPFVFPADNQIIIKTPIVLGGGRVLQTTGAATRTFGIGQRDVSFVVGADGPLEVSLIAPNGDEITPGNYEANTDYRVHYHQDTFYELDRESTADEGQARLRFVLASPALEQVDVTLDGVTIFADVSFTDPSQIEYVGLNPGSHTLEIVPIESAQDALTVELDAAPGQDYTLLAVGGDVAEAMVFADDNGMPEALGQARVRFVNGSAENEALDLWIGGSPVFASVPYRGGVDSYQSVPAGDHTFEIKHGGVLLSPSDQIVSFEAGRIYTFITAGPVDDHPVAWLQTLDEAYLTRYFTEYGVDQAEAGEWEMKLGGDLDEIEYYVAALGPTNPPILRELSVDLSDLSQTEVSWRLISDYTPTTVTVYVTPGPITRTLDMTDTDGLPIQVVVPSFEGFTVDQVVIDDGQHLAGELTTRSVDLSALPSGDYYMWIRAEDGVNPPVPGYLAPPGAEDYPVEVARDGYDPLAQLANAAVIHVQQEFEDSWSASIRPSLNLEEADLYVEWDALNHPDVDDYLLHVGTSPQSPERVISAGGAIQAFDENGQAVGEPVAFATLHNVEPGQTYYLSVEAADTEHERGVRSQEVAVEVSTGDFSLGAPADTYEINRGTDVVVPVSLSIHESLFYPEVSLAIDTADAPLGLTAQFAGDLEGTTTLTADNSTVNVVISAAEGTPKGVYVLTISGHNGQAVRTLDIFLEVKGNVLPVVDAGPDQTVGEGELVSLALATFHDDDFQDTHTAIIDWGDGTQDVGVIAKAPLEMMLFQRQLMAFDPTFVLFLPLIGMTDSAIMPTMALSQPGSDGTVWGSHVYGDNGVFQVKVTVTDNDGGSGSDSFQVTVNNVDPVVEIDVDSRTIQYSDHIDDVTFTATDVAADALAASPSYDVDGVGFSAGLPNNLTLADNGCAVAGGENTCTWTLAGIMDGPAGVYTVRLTVNDDDGGAGYADIIITVGPEDATASFHAGNPVAVKVAEEGGDSGFFEMEVRVREAYPDNVSDGSTPYPGDIGLGQVSMTLIPVGPGGVSTGDCTLLGVFDEEYDAFQRVVCGFDAVPVNTYLASVTLDGVYYSGYAEDVLVVYDPSRGYATGGGQFDWPNTDEEELTKFGFTMEYNKSGSNVKGSMVLIRRRQDGSIYQIKSNALYGLSLGVEVENEEAFGWASFSGKATYLEPGWPEPIGNHGFLVYIEDRNEPGSGPDRFWIEVYDKDDNVIDVMSIVRPATDYAEPLTEGNIFVPH